MLHVLYCMQVSMRLDISEKHLLVQNETHVPGPLPYFPLERTVFIPFFGDMNANLVRSLYSQSQHIPHLRRAASAL